MLRGELGCQTDDLPKVHLKFEEEEGRGEEEEGVEEMEGNDSEQQQEDEEKIAWR